jgi:hypothetical protein
VKGSPCSEDGASAPGASFVAAPSALADNAAATNHRIDLGTRSHGVLGYLLRATRESPRMTSRLIGSWD